MKTKSEVSIKKVAGMGKGMVARLAISLALWLSPAISWAQKPSLGGLSSRIQQEANHAKRIAEMAIGLALLAGLVYVIWALANGNERAKGYVLMWVVAAIFYGVVFDWVNI